jgi:hypothetical protein
VFGEGDSHTREMVVFTNTNLAVGTWVDVTTEAASPSSSTFTVFPGVTAGNTIYFGGDFEFPGLKVDTTTAIVLGGSGAIEWEYWNGSAWTDLPVMATKSTADYDQYSNGTFGRVASEQIRFGQTTGWATTSLNDESKYWVRCRITTAITTSPVMQQVKLHTNRMEINADGFIEFFGAARPTRDLVAPFKLAEDLSGSSPGNEALTLASGITITPLDNRFNNSALDGNGFLIVIPEGLSTCHPLEFTVEWIPKDSGSGDVEITFDYAILLPTDALDGTKAVTQLAVVTSVDSDEDVPQTSTFSFVPETACPGDKLIYAYRRDARGSNSNDTYASRINIVRPRS